MEYRSTCTVLISSCDKYADLWGPFFKLFNKNWKDCPFNIALITEEKEANIDGVRSLALGRGKSWSLLLSESLEIIDTPYVLLMLEDFFIRDKVNSKDIEELLVDMKENSLNMLRLIPRPAPDIQISNNIKEYGAISSFSHYRVSTQAAFWRVSVLKGIIRVNENAWEFEVNGTKRGVVYDNFYCTYDVKIPYYHHVVERGKWFLWEVWRYKNTDIVLDLSKRKVMSLSESLWWICRKIFAILRKKIT